MEIYEFLIYAFNNRTEIFATMRREEPLSEEMFVKESFEIINDSGIGISRTDKELIF